MKLKALISTVMCFMLMATGVSTALAYEQLAPPVGITSQGMLPVVVGPLLDDFNYGSGINSWGDVTGVFSSVDPPTANVFCTASYTDDPLVTFGDKAYSLQLDYNVADAGSYVGYVSSLAGADLSSYNYISFWVKGAASGEFFKVELKNNSTTRYWSSSSATSYFQNSAAVYITDYLDGGVTTGWQKVTIPLDAFTNLDGLTSMKEFVLVFENSQSSDNGSSTSGRIYVDNISFGKQFLGFVRVDHFSDKIGTSALGGNRGEGVAGANNPTITSDIDFVESSSGCLSLNYRLPAWAGAWSFTPIGGGNTDDTCEQPGEAGWIKVPRDFGAYNSLHFKIKSSSVGDNPEVMKIELHDDPGGAHSDYVVESITTAWDDRDINFSSFTEGGTLDPSTIEEMVFVLEYWRIFEAKGGQGPTITYSGTVYIEDMEFRAAGYTGPDTTPPSTPSAPGINTASQPIVLTTTADSRGDDPSMENVRFEYYDGSAWKTIGYDYDTANSSYSAQWYTTNFSPGDYNVRAIAMDSAGNISISGVSVYTKPNTPPEAGVINPSSGSSLPGEERYFTTTYHDFDGWQDLLYGYFRVSTGGARRARFEYRVATNKLYLLNDDGTASLGGYEPGSGGIVENTYCKLNCTNSEVSKSGNTLTVKWAVIFKAPLAGETHDLYLYTKDKSGARTGWQQKGTWSVE